MSDLCVLSEFFCSLSCLTPTSTNPTWVDF